MSQLFTSGGQSIGASASASVLPMNIQGWFPLGLTGLTPCNPKDSQDSSQHLNSKASVLQCSALFMVQLIPRTYWIRNFWGQGPSNLSFSESSSDSGYEIKRRLLFGRKAITNLERIKKQRHHFVDNGPYSQIYGFSCSHVQMWKLNHKESWAPKN